MCQNNQKQTNAQMLSKRGTSGTRGNNLFAKQCNILCPKLPWVLRLKVTMAIHIFVTLTETLK